jgi:hypothetical protein
MEKEEFLKTMRVATVKKALAQAEEAVALARQAHALADIHEHNLLQARKAADQIDGRQTMVN